MEGSRLHIVYGAACFVLLVLMVIGFSFCGSYKNKTQNLSSALNNKTAENENLLGRVESLEDELGKTKSDLTARSAQADNLESALTALRKDIKTVEIEKAKVEQEKLSLIKQATGSPGISGHPGGALGTTSAHHHG